MLIKIGIKDLAIFTNQSGNLTNDFFSNKDLNAGDVAHKKHQAKYNEKSLKEVYIKKEFSYLEHKIILHGFIDGVLNIDDEIILEEIKTTLKEFDELDPLERKEYFAQLKIYAYLYALDNNMENVHLRLTYISNVDYETKSFDYIQSLDELEKFVFDCLEKYMEWYNLRQEAEKNKNETIKTIKFPYPNMRLGQRDMMKACFQVMRDEEILYCIAPTGIGKTMATLFSSLKTLEENDKLFYLTAKGSGKNAPLSAVKLLNKNGLKVKAINLIAKKKICNAKFKNCNPTECPFAIGFFDRVREAIMEIYTNYDVFDEYNIIEIATKHKICAFEFSLDLSYYCDIIIADYNYVFDPRAQLVRYFQDDSYHPKVLVDEAHNLIPRSKEMYSAIISEEDIRILRKTLTGYKPSVRNDCNKVIEKISSYKEYLVEKTILVNNTNDLDLGIMLKRLLSSCDQLFEENKVIKNKDDALDVYFKILKFVNICDFFGPNYRFIAKLDNDICSINLMCLDASEFILDTIKKNINGIVFFSATLTPFKYHSDLLTKGEGKFLELNSPFDPSNFDIIINNSISTRYKERNQSIDYILEAIDTLVSTKKGNYIIFFPSYQYMNMVIDSLGETEYEVLVQKSSFTDIERNEMINKFTETKSTKVGFFVLGGVFAEGIDYVGDYLNGVIIVGVGLPMYCDENNILKDYFQELYNNGFDYAYTYPGFTKVVQAAGRVIRSETDRGVCILIDERFTHTKYYELMPRHWLNKKVITDSYYLKKEILNFNKEK